jgi:uncharacterized protein
MVFLGLTIIYSALCCDQIKLAFSGHPRGVEASAVLYSLVITAKENGLEPYYSSQSLYISLNCHKKILTEVTSFCDNSLMEIKEFEWDDNNIEHIAMHNISPDEVEDVAFDDDPWVKRGRKDTRYLLGYTIAGRYLFVVYVLKGKGVVRVITAMDMDNKTKKLYKKRKRGRQ